MNAKQLSATTLRIILVTTLLLAVFISFAVFYFGSTMLREVSNDISGVITEETSSKTAVDTLRQTELLLEEHEATMERAAGIAAESQSYMYQDQIIQDLTRFANGAGVSITSITFTEPDTGSATPEPVATDPESEPGASAEEAPAAPTSGNLRSTSASITLASPANYRNFLQFVRAIEQNLTKMQVQSINLSQAEESNQITSDSLTVQVYIQ